MSRLIKFPSQLKPTRVTPRLARRDEVFSSPETGIQQIASRGNAFWSFSIEYKDLSESERDIVQAFLAKCQGRRNTFKIPDYGNYEVPGDVSTWTDIYSGHGSFAVTSVGSSTIKVNSWFIHHNYFSHHVSDDGLLRFEWRRKSSAGNLRANNEMYSEGQLESGKAYIQRIKHFPHPDKIAHSFSFQVGSESTSYIVQSFPNQVRSADCITGPFFSGTEVSSLLVSVIDWSYGDIGDYFAYADYRLARCALVSNSENLITRSNEFDHADWTVQNASVTSGGETSPLGTTDGAWKFFVSTTVNSHHNLVQAYTKISTEDFYTASLRAKASEKGELILRVDGGSSSQYAQAVFWLNSGTTGSLSVNGDFTRPYAKIFDIGSGWYRCAITALVNSSNSVRLVAFISSGTGFQFTGNGSDGIWIAEAQLKQHPFPGQYCPTVTSSLIGSNYQTGSKLVIEGLEPETKIKAGTRFEVVTQFHDRANGLYERSEFKRVTEEAVVHREGHAILEFDPPIRNAPIPTRSWRQQAHLGETVHNPVIFADPEIKVRLSDASIIEVEKPLKMYDITFEVIEDLTS